MRERWGEAAGREGQGGGTGRETVEPLDEGPFE